MGEPHLTRENAAVRLLDSMMQNARASPPTLALLYDELALSLSLDTLHFSLSNWITQQLQITFEPLFMMDLEAGKLRSSKVAGTGLKAEAAFGLDGPDATFAINILECLAEESKRAQLVLLCPLFSLMQANEAFRSKGSLEELDALLGSCMLLPRWVFSAPNFKDILW